MVKQKIKVFDATYKEDLEKHVNDWLNNKNNKDIKVLSISASNQNQYGGFIVVIHYECEENISNEFIIPNNFKKTNNLKKITLREFWTTLSIYRKICIHCDTKEKVRKIFENTNKANCKDKEDSWDEYKEATCFSAYGYGPIEYFKDNEYTIYEFEDIIFE